MNGLYDFRQTCIIEVLAVVGGSSIVGMVTIHNHISLRGKARASTPSSSSTNHEMKTKYGCEIKKSQREKEEICYEKD